MINDVIKEPVLVEEPVVAPFKGEGSESSGIDIGGITELAPMPMIYPAVFDKPQMDTFVKAFKNSKGGPSKILARQIANEVTPDTGLFTYNTLRDGTALFFSYSEKTKNLSPLKRRLSDDQIIALLARDTEGNKLQAGEFLEGFKRDIGPQLSSAAGFVGGAKLGAKVPGGPAVKLGGGIIGGIAGAISAYKAGEVLTDKLLGPERPLLPGQSEQYEKGKTGAGVAGFFAMPFAISKNVQFGTALYLSNLAKGQASNAVVKTPRSIKFVQGVENMLNRTRTAAFAAPGEFVALEAIVGAGQITGAGFAERTDPGGVGSRLLYETLGGVGFNIIGAPTTTFLANASKMKETFKRIKATYEAGGAKAVLSPLEAARQNKAVTRILEILEAEGEDIEAILKRLSGDDITSLLVDDAGKPIQLTAGAKSGSPALLAIEASLDQLGSSLGNERTAGAKASIKALRNVIWAMSQTGDQDAIQQAGDLAEEVFSSQLTERMNAATENVLSAFGTVKGDNPETNIQISERLYDVLLNQMKIARAQENRLWRSVPDVTVNRFFDEDGAPTETPLFVSAWLNEFEGSPEEYVDELSKGMPAVARFVKRKITELGLEESESVVPDSGELRAATKRLNTALTKLQGTGFDERVAATMRGDQFGSSQEPAAIMERLRSEAKLLKDATYSTPTIKERNIKLANAFEAQADVISISSRVDATDPAADLIELTSNDLAKTRSLALSNGRALVSQGKMTEAGLAFKMADAMLKDLENFPQSAGQDTWRVAYDMARAYSRGLNNTYTRAFAGDALSKTKQGGEQIAPELLAKRILQGGNDPTYVRIKEINDIAVFSVEQGLEGAENLVPTLRGITETILRNARTAAFDPNTGEMNPKMLQKYVNENKDLLDKFPSLRDDLLDAERANVLLRDETIVAKNKMADEQAQLGFYDVMNPVLKDGKRRGTENPVSAIARALNVSASNKTPIANMNRLLLLVENVKDPDLKDRAMSGLKSSILEWAATKAGISHSGTFSPSALYDAVFRPIKGSKGKIPLMEWMLEKKVMNQAEASNMKTYLAEMVKFEAAEQSGEIGELVDKAGPILDFYLGITGSVLGTTTQKILMGGNSGPGALIAAGKGAETMRKIFADIPAALQTDVMSELMRNPQLLATMMRKPRSERERRNIVKYTTDLLSDLGFRPARTALPGAIREFERDTNEIYRAPPEPMPNPLPDGYGSLAPEQRPSPVVSPTTQASAVPSPAPAPVNSGPVDRTRYAALFPNDSISGMMKTQMLSRGGIASLMR